MIIDIFSRFDPGFYSCENRSFIFFFFFISIFITFIFIINFWILPNRILNIIILIISFILSQSKRTIGNRIKGFNRILNSLFIFIIIINLFGLVPYIFRVSSHLVFSLAFGLSIWIRLIISGIFIFFSTFLAIFLPSGAPGWLNPFLVLVETVRILVRPITLSFRLAANLRAGHIVLVLIGVYARRALFNSIISFFFLIFLQMFFIIFEIGVGIIQSYIFCLLASLYREDHPVH